MFEERPPKPDAMPRERLPYVTDPTIDHLVTIEREDAAQRGRRRVTCACGLDAGWQTPIAAIRDAAFHRDRVLAAKRVRDLDDLPIPLVEREHDRGSLFRWCCDRCPAVGGWVPSEAVASVGSILHVDVCPRTDGR